MKPNYLSRLAMRVVLPLFSLLVMGITSARADPPPSDLWDGNWHYSLTPYGWLPGISAKLRYQIPNTGTVQNETKNNIFDYLSGAFMLEGDARIGDWGIYGDFDWVNFSGEKGRFSSIGGERIGGNASLNTDWDLKGGMFTLAGLYSLAHGHQGYIDLVFGARYLWIKSNLDWNFTATGNNGNLNIANDGHVSAQSHVTDAVVGVRGIWSPFDQSSWYFPYYFDIGGGSSNNTYQFKGGVAYGFSWGNIALLYREVQYHHTGGEDFLKKIRLSGPAISATWNF